MNRLERVMMKSHLAERPSGSFWLVVGDRPDDRDSTALGEEVGPK